MKFHRRPPTIFFWVCKVNCGPSRKLRWLMHRAVLVISACSVVVVVVVACCCCIPYLLMLMLAPTFAPCVLTFAPYILTFGPCACGVSLLSNGAKIPLAQVVVVTSCNTHTHTHKATVHYSKLTHSYTFVNNQVATIIVTVECLLNLSCTLCSSILWLKCPN